MERNHFEQLVADALHSLPQEFRERLENIEVVVEDKPTPEKLTEVGLGPGDTLYGLYEGVPLTRRTTSYGLVLPDKISIYQRPIESSCYSDEEIKRKVRRVVQHEIAHYFGFDDEQLDEMGR